MASNPFSLLLVGVLHQRERNDQRSLPAMERSFFSGENMTTLHDCIVQKVREGQLKEPFCAKDVKSVCSGWADSTYSASLAKHEKDYLCKYIKYYKRVSRGLYKLIRKIQH
jgi:hypothetical protein